MKSDQKRLIKPTDSRFRIIWKLRNKDENIVVYDTGIPAEDAAYRKVHNVLWKIHNDGLIIYGSDTNPDNRVMLARITFEGKEWLRNGIYRNAQLLLIVITALLTFLN